MRGRSMLILITYILLALYCDCFQLLISHIFYDSMQTTYQAFYTPRRSRLNRTLGRARNTTSTDRYNDPDTNYDDPARPPPPFVSRLQPLSFTSGMAPLHVAECPVPFAYPASAAATVS